MRRRGDLADKARNMLAVDRARLPAVTPPLAVWDDSPADVKSSPPVLPAVNQSGERDTADETLRATFRSQLDQDRF